MKKQAVICALMVLGLSGCGKNPAPETTEAAAPASTMVEAATKPRLGKNGIVVGKDYHSLSNPEEMKVTHVFLDLEVDFERKVLAGAAELSLERVKPDVKRLILDTRDLTIHSVTAGEKQIPFTLMEADPHLGSALLISVPKKATKVKVHYETSPDASGVQWLTPQQTAGKQHPFLFTQAQAIHARSFIPLQDTPKVG